MMPHKFRPVTALLLFTGLNAILVSTITPVYDSVCFHPYWERRGLPAPLGRKHSAQKHGTERSTGSPWKKTDRKSREQKEVFNF
ncbi:uncharacterized protein LOC130790109 isoform X4 [Actinidia eriantha]|uniref:uncharacterized protein LOC130790109 isoform X4 n=1 Tax=Actinidia eriantha TaxID=165200 RepID=UPI00258D7B41|nr:uncharacterized protein LOC130790109 isoform X4 [Actinidia eriantha]